MWVSYGCLYRLMKPAATASVTASGERKPVLRGSLVASAGPGRAEIVSHYAVDFLARPSMSTDDMLFGSDGSASQMLAKSQPSAAQGGRQHSTFPTSIGLPGGSASTDFYQRTRSRRRTRRAMATLTWALALVDLRYTVCHITKTYIQVYHVSYIKRVSMAKRLRA